MSVPVNNFMDYVQEEKRVLKKPEPLPHIPQATKDRFRFDYSLGIAQLNRVPLSLLVKAITEIKAYRLNYVLNSIYSDGELLDLKYQLEMLRYSLSEAVRVAEQAGGSLGFYTFIWYKNSKWSTKHLLPDGNKTLCGRDVTAYTTVEKRLFNYDTNYITCKRCIIKFQRLTGEIK